MKILHLTLKKKWFDMIVSGNTYDIVRFRNGYKKESPTCDVEYLGTREGGGIEKWGAQPAVIYRIISLGKVRHLSGAS